MKCTFVASSAYSCPSVSSSSLPASVSSGGSATAGGCSSVPTSGAPPELPLASSWETLSIGVPTVTPVSFPERSKHSSKGCWEVKVFLYACKGSWFGIRRSLGASPAASPPALCPRGGRRLGHVSCRLQLCASCVWESCLHFGGLCHTAGPQQKSWEQCGNSGRNIHVPLEGPFLSFPQIYPTPKEEGKHNAY